MARTETGRRLFAVKVWREWLPPVNGESHIELCLLLVLGPDRDDAAVQAWSFLAERLESFVQLGGQSYCDGEPVQIYGLGVDQVFDTGRSELSDFDDDPLVFTYLFPVHGDRQIDFFVRDRLVQPPVVRRGHAPFFGLPKEGLFLDGELPRWFGVKVWRTWEVDGNNRFFEEVVLMVRATSSEDASERATTLALEADSDVMNDRDEECSVRVVNVDYVFDCHRKDLIDQEEREVFGQLYSSNPDDTVEFYDSDNDLPFRDFALGD